MSDFVNSFNYLAPDPDSSYRQLRVKGRRIFARTLYGLTVGEEGRLTPEEVAADYGLPLQAVQEAIAYCESNPPEIAEDWAMDEARANGGRSGDCHDPFDPDPATKRPETHSVSGCSWGYISTTIWHRLSWPVCSA